MKTTILPHCTQNSQLEPQACPRAPLATGNTKPYSYSAYGLGIHSVLPLPEFVPAATRPDVTIRIERDRNMEQLIPPEAIEQPWALQLDRTGAIVYLKDTAVFQVRNGREILIVPAPGASAQDIRLPLTGTIMAILLYQRGSLVLHASAVNLNGQAIAFLGHSGEGKSTITAALHAQGHALIADDIAAVTLNDGSATLAASFPQLKLCEDIAQILNCQPEALHPLHPHLAKQGYRPADTFQVDSLTLHQLYILSSGPDLHISPLSLQDAALELCRHTYLSTLFHSGDATQFLQAAALAKACPVYRLQRPRDLALLPAVVRQVEEHVAADSCSPATPI